MTKRKKLAAVALCVLLMACMPLLCGRIAAAGGGDDAAI